MPRMNEQDEVKRIGEVRDRLNDFLGNSPMSDTFDAHVNTVFFDNADTDMTWLLERLDWWREEYAGLVDDYHETEDKVHNLEMLLRDREQDASGLARQLSQAITERDLARDQVEEWKQKWEDVLEHNRA